MAILSNSNVTKSTLENDDKFLSLASFTEIISGSLNSNFLIGKLLVFILFSLYNFKSFNIDDYNMVVDVIGQAIDIGDIQVIPVQGKETKKLQLTLTDTE